MVIRRVSNSGRKAKKVTPNTQDFQDDTLAEIERASREREGDKGLDWFDSAAHTLALGEHILKTRKARRVKAGAKGGNARAENFKPKKSKVLERARKAWQDDSTLSVSEVAKMIQGSDDKLPTLRRWISPAKPRNK